jgi:hypothetical protein
MIKHKNLYGLIALLFVVIFFLSRCIQYQPEPDPRGTAFAPPETCRNCHRAIYDSALLTAHFNASAKAAPGKLAGNFNTGNNSFIYDSTTRVVMEKRDSGLYQVLYKNGQQLLARRFDIVFGITHAQTALYWQHDVAYELPISHYTAYGWGTSPGYSATMPDFTRLIGRDCFECHSSYIKNKANSNGSYFSEAGVTEQMEQRSLVYGIDCQRCHGPAAQHAAYHLENPGTAKGKYIVLQSSLGRQQQLDQCAVCHSGNDKRKLKSRFFFRPGDMLADYFLPSLLPDSGRHFDVHGNQYNLLKQSACFLQSNSMTCTSCHNPHQPSAISLAAWSKKCMNCHTEAGNNFCTATPAAGTSLKDNCIDCHMPKQVSGAISFTLSGSEGISAYLLRTHRVAVYKDKKQPVISKH